MIEIFPKNVFSWTYIAQDGEESIGHLAISHIRERGSIQVGSTTYEVYRKRGLTTRFYLESQGVPLAHATKTSTVKRVFAVDLQDCTFHLKAASAFRRSIVLVQDEHVVGSITPVGMFRRRARVDLPEHLALPTRLFLAWLAVLLWKRNQV